MKLCCYYSLIPIEAAVGMFVVIGQSHVPLNGSSSFNAEFGHYVVTPATVATSILGAVPRCLQGLAKLTGVRQGEDKQL